MKKIPSTQVPKLEVKCLPIKLKYAFLSNYKTFLIIILSNLCSIQEGDMPTNWSAQDKRKFLVEVRSFFWDDPYLFKYFPNQIIQKGFPR